LFAVRGAGRRLTRDSGDRRAGEHSLIVVGFNVSFQPRPATYRATPSCP
jgi:hypothetical protein